MNRFSLVLVGTLLLMAGAVVLILVPLWRSANEAATNIALAERTLTLQSKQRTTSQDEAAYNALQERTNKLGVYYIQSKESVAFFDSLDTLADQSGINQTLRLLTEPSQQKRQPIDIEFTLNGDYSKVIDYLDKLQRQSWLLVLRQLEINVENPTSGTVRAIATVNTLWE